MVPCRPTLLYKRDYVENSTAVISLIDYKDRDKFPFYPNKFPQKFIESDENTICMVLTFNDYYATFLSLHMHKPKNHCIG